MTDTDTVLFDLDGTLVDTAPDMARALNQLLQEHGRAELGYDAIRPHVSRGAAGLLALGFGRDIDDAYREALREQFLRYYRADLATESRPFPGIEPLLDRLAAAEMRWGVVTNKPGWLAEPLLEGLGLAARAACIVSGDTLAKRKPDPEPLWHACEQAGTSPGRTVYVGDDERDIVAGRRAGMRTVVALFGYLGDDTPPDTWGADAMIEHPGELPRHLGLRDAPSEAC